MKKLVLAAMAALCLAPASVDAAKHVPGCNTRSCDVRMKKKCLKSPACSARVERKKLAREMRYYRAHPLPWCTWGPESSGPPYDVPEFSMRRYRAYNASSGAAGKFQIIPSTWSGVGGLQYATSARYALPVIQERLARRVARYGISSQWVNC